VTIPQLIHPKYYDLLPHIPIPPRPLPKYILLDLARTRLRQLLHNFDFPGHHKATNTAIILGPLNHLAAQRLAICSIFSSHKRFGPLAPVRIGDGADADLEDGGVC
jgi:hypothetical protein